MTTEQILIVAFGAPTIALLTGIFFRMGKLEATSISLKGEMAQIWAEIFRIKEKMEGGEIDMNIHLRKMRLKARNTDQASAYTSEHLELAARARALGCPAFCVGWPTETLIRKIEERENANS